MTALSRHAAALLLSVAALAAASMTSANTAPEIVSTPPTLATVARDVVYAVEAVDADGDAIEFSLAAAPPAATIDAAGGELRWRPAADDIGLHGFVVAVVDEHGARDEQAFDLRVLADFCPIYPLALPHSLFESATPGTQLAQIDRGTGSGNYSWLSWAGAPDANTLAASLLPPGDSFRYVNPDDPSDTLLEIGDWVHGATGSMNASAVRVRLDALKDEDIIVPTWSTVRGQGNRLDYHVADFVRVRLLDYQLTGQGWISVEYRGRAHCYNLAPEAFDLALSTERDTPLPLTLPAEDPDGDSLEYLIVEPPAHGRVDGEGAERIYVPDPGYLGEDRFTWRATDGKAESNLAVVTITVTRRNLPPVILSPPVTVVGEDAPYHYPVQAADPDGDVLAYRLDDIPPLLAIDRASGAIGGLLDGRYVQPVRDFNRFCYVIPDDGEFDADDGSFMAPLFQRVRTAIGRASTYVAPQTEQWHRHNTCLGCHVQTQGLLGLQGSMDKADVDEAVAEYLLDEILGSQQADGSIRRSHPEFSRTQTAFALWALSYVPDRGRTLLVRERGLRFFLARRIESGATTYWTQDHNSGWLNSPTAASAMVALSAGRFLHDAARLPNVDLSQLQLALELQPHLPRMAEFFLAQPANSSDALVPAFSYVGLGELRAHLGDDALLARVDARMAELDATLRSRERAGGGWHRYNSGAADPLVSAWVGFALNHGAPAITDPVVVRNIEFLLDAQRVDGTWHTNSGLFGAPLATAGLVMAYLPVALEHLGNPDLTVGHLRLQRSAAADVVAVEIINRGLADVAQPSTVLLHAGHDGTGAQLANVETGPLRSGESRWVTIELAAGAVDGDLHALVLADPAVDECDIGNNSSSAAFASVRATDPGGLFDTQAWLINVEDANSDPLITSDPVTVLALGLDYAYQVSVADADIGDAHEFALATAPRGLFIHPLTGRLGYALAELAVGDHPVTVRVTDLRGGTAEQSYVLSVLPNQAPTITSTPPLSVEVGNEYLYQVAATDPDGDALSFRLDGAPLTMEIDAESGLVSWTPAAVHVGGQPVAVVVEDGRGGSDRQAFVLQVLAANRAPQIGSSPPTQAIVGQPYVYQVLASDPDGDPLLHALLQAPSGMGIDAASGRIDWLPTEAQLGRHTVTIEVSDGRGGSDRQSYELAVNDANRAPLISSTPPQLAIVGERYVYEVVASDPDGDALSYARTHAPSGMAIDGDGRIEWMPSSAQIGVHEVALEVADGRGGTATQTYTLQAVAAGDNRPPQITSTPAASVELGASYRYDIVASDPDGDPLTYRLAAGPTGMQLDAISGALRWTPQPSDLGDHTVAVEVIDGRGGSATQTWTLAVIDRDDGGNRPPTITSTPPMQAKVGRIYHYAASAFDADGDAIEWSLTTAPAGMSVDAVSGVVEWTPAESGSVDVNLRASDGSAWSEQSWSITVHPADAALTVTLAATPEPVAAGATLAVTTSVGGAAGPLTVRAWLGAAEITLAPNATTAITAPAAPGAYLLRVEVADGFDEASAERTVTVVDASDATPPSVQLLTPAEHPDHDAVELSAPTPITANVSGDHIVRWVLAVRERGSTATRLLAEGRGEVEAGEVGMFDPTLLLNGQYTLILQAWNAAGGTAVDSRIVTVTGDMKIGHFSISFEEVSIPVAGIPVMVTRTYDTRQAHQSLDFGHGWTVDTRSMRIHESRTIGFGWGLYEHRQGFFSTWCVRPNGDPIVSVTMPDGDIATFRARAEPECTQLVPQVDVHLVFEPVSNTKGARLAQTDYGMVRAANFGDAWHLIDLGDPFGPIDPNNYRLTTADGLVFDVHQHNGLRRVTEPATGHTLSWTASGVRHSTGVGIDFIRDGAGRITQLRLPDGETIDYTYTAAGDLETVADPIGGVTSFAYDARIPHYLRDIIDPRGVRVARNEYDDAGRLIATIDADGHRIEFEHAIDARTSRLRDRNGHWILYQYDGHGRVLVETNLSLGTTISRSYDANGNMLSQTDPQGRTASWTYDARGNVLTETDPAGATITRTYNAQNQLLTQRGPDGQLQSSNEYDSRTGTQLLRTTDALGQVTAFGYSEGNLTALTDAAGAQTRFGYDFHGNLASETDALGRVTAYVNDASGRLTRETRSRTRADGSTEQLVTRYTYDAKGNVIAIEHPDGSTRTTEYDGNDKPIRECDPLGRCTQTEYDARGNVARTVYADGSVATNQYDANGNLIAETDRAGRTTKYVFDAANRIVETIFPDADADDGDDGNNPRIRNVYDAAGQLIETIDENGHVTRHEYDAAGRRIRTLAPAIDGAHAVVVSEFDAEGRTVATIDAAGRRTEYVYDAVGRQTEVVHPDGSRSRTEYDAVGRKTADIDEAGRITRYGYDALGRLTVVVLPNPGTGANPPLVDNDSPDAGTLVTRYQYDEVGNKIAQTDAEGRTTRWEYDAMGRETARILPGGEREEKQYNLAGELIALTDFNGATTRYHFDALGRLERIEYPTDADVRFGYNAADERVQAIDGRGTSSRAHDRRGRLVQAIDADGGLIEYTYDAAGNLLARISPHQSLQYAYDARHRLTEVTRTIDGEAPSVTRYTYDNHGKRIAMEGGDGLRTEYAYDTRHRLSSLVKRGAAGAMLLAMNYTVDASGLRTGVEELDPIGTVRTVEYRYDGVRRLTDEIIVHRDAARGRISAWTYDRVGNRLSQMVMVGGVTETTAYAYDVNDRLLTETTDGAVTSYSYDANGNTIERSGHRGTVSYRYNDANRLIEALGSDGATAYVYDADGLRVRQTHTAPGAPSVTTWYVQDSNFPYAQVVETHVSEGAGPRRLAAAYAFADELIAQTRFDSAGLPSTHFVHADGFGSTRWLTTVSGAITDSIDYDAFGNEIDRSGATDVEHLYRGEAFDPNVGFYYLRARWMDPVVGRMLGMDPFSGFSASPHSLHKYAFNHQDPVNRIDPSGMISVGAVITAGMNVVSASVARVGVSFAASKAAGGMALRTVGVATQRAVNAILVRLVGSGSVQQNVLLRGQGGRRIIDFWVQVQNRVLALEVKYKLPAHGSAAMARLVGQMQTATSQAVAAEYRVVLFTWQAPTAAQQAAVLRALGPTASNVEVVSGALNLVQYIRNFFMLAL
jgi:RHS repeat-associated protein